VRSASGTHSAAELAVGFDAEVAQPDTNRGFSVPVQRQVRVAVADSDDGHDDVLVSGHQSHIAWVTSHDGDLAVGRRLDDGAYV
jgi:hypothetical protein